MIYKIIFLPIMVLFFACFDKAPKIKYKSKIKLKVEEPSGISYSATKNAYAVVSDDGVLYKLDKEGKKIGTAKHKGVDFEDVFIVDDLIMVVDEASRKLLTYSWDLKHLKTQRLNYQGGRNKGYESLCYDNNGNFYAITETEPILIQHYDKDLNMLNEFEFKHADDISSATLHQGFLWLLSDEDMTVMKVDVNEFKVLEKWRIPILNPEGICFIDNGDMVIVSDDLAQMYFFDNPSNSTK